MNIKEKLTTQIEALEKAQEKALRGFDYQLATSISMVILDYIKYLNDNCKTLKETSGALDAFKWVMSCPRTPPEIFRKWTPTVADCKDSD